MSGELAFIDRLRALATSDAARGFGDDAAILEIGGETLVLTHDVLVEGVHIFPGTDPADIAWKLVAANMGDLAAKGAEPVGILLGHMLGEGDERFVSGLRDAMAHFDAPLLGGDTVSAGQAGRSWGMTAIGRATHVPVPTRDGAQVGDGIYVTGKLGGAMIGYEAVRDGRDADCTPFLRPSARLAEGQALAPLVSAMMDISDGLLLDAWRMAQASGVSFAIESDRVPVATPEDRRNDALRWGEDFELLFTAPMDRDLPVKATKIGEVGDGEGLKLDGERLSGPDGLGYEHRT